MGFFKHFLFGKCQNHLFKVHIVNTSNVPQIISYLVDRAITHLQVQRCCYRNSCSAVHIQFAAENSWVQQYVFCVTPSTGLGLQDLVIEPGIFGEWLFTSSLGNSRVFVLYVCPHNCRLSLSGLPCLCCGCLLVQSSAATLEVVSWYINEQSSL
jgi:hypothetical protein